MNTGIHTGAITGYIDVAQLVLYAFWIFFAGLIYYLHREDKREGYPLESDRSGRVEVQGFPRMPAPKTYLLAGGGTVQSPRVERDTRTILAAPMGPYLGAPLVPTGNPMIDAVGPAAYAERANHPDYMMNGEPMIVPCRLAPGFMVSPGDPDPRGMQVYGADRISGGIVTEIWVDRAEAQIRYLEVEVGGGSTAPAYATPSTAPAYATPSTAPGYATPSAAPAYATPAYTTPAAAPVYANPAYVASGTGEAATVGRPATVGAKRVLLPITFTRFDASRRRVIVKSILGTQFATVPVTASLDQVTRREEDRIMAYYASGNLYATAARAEPLL